MVRDQGIRVTVTKVREALGNTGSYTTISTYLKEWRELEQGAVGGDGQQLPGSIEGSALKLIRSIWRALLLVTQRAAEQMDEKNTHKLAALEQELHQSEHELHALEQRYSNQDRQFQQMTAELLEDKKVLLELEAELSCSRDHLQTLLEKEGQLSRQIESLTRKLQHLETRRASLEETEG